MHKTPCYKVVFLPVGPDGKSGRDSCRHLAVLDSRTGTGGYSRFARQTRTRLLEALAEWNRIRGSEAEQQQQAIRAILDERQLFGQLKRRFGLRRI